ncbi:HAMP domain-containing sensor histidine kinase [Enterococcus sp. LJL98]
MKKMIKKRVTLRTIPILFVFMIMLCSYLLLGLIVKVLRTTGLYDSLIHPIPGLAFFGTLLTSTLIGTGLAALFSRKLIAPLSQISEATKKVADGDFDVRLAITSIKEVEDLAENFNTMVQEISTIETLRSDFTSNFSHEFKTPIVSIRGFAKLLQDKNLPDVEREEYTQIIIEESQRLSQLATNILDLTKLENTAILTERHVFSLDEQIRRVAALLEPHWHEKQLDVTLKLTSLNLCNDEDLLQQVWLNLFDNGIKFSEPHGKILIELVEVNGMAQFTISDHGIGMSPETIQHLFDKFYQGDASRAEKGNGLGLSLVKRILVLCEGTIEVKSKEGFGSQFIVTLPLK